MLHYAHPTNRQNSLVTASALMPLRSGMTFRMIPCCHLTLIFQTQAKSTPLPQSIPSITILLSLLSLWWRNTLCPWTYEICLWNCSSALESVANHKLSNHIKRNDCTPVIRDMLHFRGIHEFSFLRRCKVDLLSHTLCSKYDWFKIKSCKIFPFRPV